LIGSIHEALELPLI